MLYYVYIFFFFKQKTAYEMRISDWSSDVCSSDLPLATHDLAALDGGGHLALNRQPVEWRVSCLTLHLVVLDAPWCIGVEHDQIGVPAHIQLPRRQAEQAGRRGAEHRQKPGQAGTGRASGGDRVAHHGVLVVV